LTAQRQPVLHTAAVTKQQEMEMEMKSISTSLSSPVALIKKAKELFPS
jgi:hypothetical protein